jgi:hypothetical protein
MRDDAERTATWVFGLTLGGVVAYVAAVMVWVFL